MREWNRSFPLDARLHRYASYFPDNYYNVRLSGRAVVNVSRSNEARYVAAHRSELDEADTTIDKWSIGVNRSPYCPRPSQTADQRFGNIWSDNILSSFTVVQTGHWPLRDFPRTMMYDDWFDKHCAHTMVNTAGRVAVRVRKIRTKSRDAQSLDAIP